MTESKFDPVSVIEAAYRLDATDKEWKEGILAMASPVLDTGMGAIVFEIDASDVDAVPIFGGAVATGADPDDLCEFVRSIQPKMTAQEIRRVYRTRFVFATASERMSQVYDDFRDDPIYRTFGHPHGIYDFQGAQIIDPSGKILILGAPVDHIASSTASRKRRWARLAAHIAAGYRLRHSNHKSDFEADDVDAVLTTDGAIAHAHANKVKRPELRRALREGTRHIEQARGSVRREQPDTAIALWKALIRGEYSLVEKVDTDGRRFMLARRNAPVVKQPSALSPRESQVVHLVALGHSNQLIAYELGLAETTISTLLSRARAKLNVDSRSDLIELAGALNALPPDGDHTA